MASQFRKSWRTAKLTPKQMAMLEYAELLTVNPSGVTFDDVEALRQAGWRDEDIVDIVHIVGAFSYLVRMADGLGIALEPEWAGHAHELGFLDGAEHKPVANEVQESQKRL